MTDPNEIRALKASFLGAMDTAATLQGLQSRVEALDDRGEISPSELEELSRVAAAHAVAAAALRGLIGTMLTRREAASK